MALPSQFAYRTLRSVGLVDAYPVYKPLFNAADANAKTHRYSPCGRWWAWSTATAVHIIDTTTAAPVMTLALPQVLELAFSPRGTYLSTWERPAKDEAGDAAKNLKVWKVQATTGSSGDDGADAEAQPAEPLGRFVQKQQEGWNLNYTSDEKYCARLVTNEVQFYESDNLTQVWNKLHVDGVRSFALGPQNQVVAVYVPQKNGQPAVVKIYSIPQFDTPLAQKTFFKGDKVKMFWNQQGTSLLARVQTEVDKSNKNYYGETMVYLLSANGQFDSRVTVDKEGPIHDVAWSPNGKEFGLVYGSMPSKAGVFNSRAVLMHGFGVCPRNTIKFSPTGRFVLVAGFGNLTGDIDVYDLEKDFKKVCTFNSGNPSVCEWSNDSCYIMTATLSPRLRVDNGVKIWHLKGTLVYNMDVDKPEEMTYASWKPMLPDQVPAIDALANPAEAHESAAAAFEKMKTPSKPVGAYRPPGARGLATPDIFKREDQGGAAHVSSGTFTSSNVVNGFGRTRRAVPGAELADPAGRSVPGAEPANPDENLSKTALKNRKKRGNKKKDSEAGAAQGAGAGPNGEASGGNGGGGASLAPPGSRDFGNGGPGNEGRSPERRANQHNRHHRSLSRNTGNRSRSNTQRGAGRIPHDFGGNGGGGAPLNAPQGPSGGGGFGQPHQHHHHQQQQQQQQQQQNMGGGSNDFNQNPHAKKIRSLQKKVRAIEELEMRQANNEKLEDTQVQKIRTKDAVIRELSTLEQASSGGSR